MAIAGSCGLSSEGPGPGCVEEIGGRPRIVKGAMPAPIPSSIPSPWFRSAVNLKVDGGTGTWLQLKLTPSGLTEELGEFCVHLLAGA